MSSALIDQGLPQILNKLGNMTSLRDTYLVEQSLLRTLCPLLGVLSMSLYRVDDKGDVLRALHNSRQISVVEDTRRVIDKIEEVTNDPDLPSHLRNIFTDVALLGKACSRVLGSELVICYPVYGKGLLQAYLVFQRDHDVTPAEDAIVQGVREVFTNYFDLLESSQRDQLTGLFNRYSLENNLDRIWNLLSHRASDGGTDDSRRSSTAETYWLGLVDVDHFKKINDNYGHIIGDEILIMVARLLESCLRGSDLIYRYGGEEFVVIVAGNNDQAAMSVFERARQRIESFDFPRVGRVTLSCGFSRADPRYLPKEVLHRADSSLYAAKSGGRNRTCFYDDLIREGVLKEAETGTIDLF